MKVIYKATPVALAVAALFASPLAYAQESVSNSASSSNSMTSTLENDVDVNLETTWELTNNITVRGTVRVNGDIRVNAESAAVVDTKQESIHGNVMNTIVDNNAKVEGNAMQNAQGNIGVNVSAGDNNAQSNDAALSAIDSRFVFASAQSFGYQNASQNNVSNFATRNNAILTGNAMQNVQGNVGVNISAGNGNIQANALSASVNDSGTLSKASSYTNQITAGNRTINQGANFQIVNRLDVSLAAQLRGSYAGSGQGSGVYNGTNGASTGNAYQMTNFYSDNWTGNTHPAGSQVGHSDFDNQSQGAVLNPGRTGIGGLGFDVVTGPSSESGTTRNSFSESGTQALAGTVSGQVVFLQTVFRPHENNATLSGNALQGAQGNIGVNIAAGTNNLQRNSLAISAARGGTGGPGGGGGELPR